MKIGLSPKQIVELVRPVPDNPAIGNELTVTVTTLEIFKQVLTLKVL